jgi:hypothetical protein
MEGWGQALYGLTVHFIYANLILISGGRMKYKRMFCWVRPHEKKELKEAVNKQFPLKIEKNYNDFKSKINENDYLILSLSKVKFGFNKIQKLIKQFSNFQFNFYELKDLDEMIAKQALIMNEKNVIIGQYSANELRDNYLEIIPDLWEMRRNEKIPQVFFDAIEKQNQN